MSGREISPEWCRKMAHLEEEVGGGIGAGLLAADPDLFGDVQGNAVAQVAHANHAGAEALKLERDRRQRRLLRALWKAAHEVSDANAELDESVRNQATGEIETEPERSDSEDMWEEFAEYVEVLHENGIDLDMPIEEQLPEDAALPAAYWSDPEGYRRTANEA